MADNDELNMKVHGSRIVFNDLIPSDSVSRNILVERSKRLAEEVGSEILSGEKLVATNYIKFKLGSNEFYGIPYHDIEDIKLAQNVTKLPFMPDYVEGVCYWHGKILPVIDLARYLGVELRGIHEGDSYMVTVSNGQRMLGLIFSDVAGVSSFENNRLDAKLATTNRIHDDYIVGIDAGTTTILNINNLINGISDDLMKVRGKVL